MSDFKGGGKAYPGAPNFAGDNGAMEKLGTKCCTGTAVNAPDHADKKPTELTSPA